jgi:hypothetical protein
MRNLRMLFLQFRKALLSIPDPRGLCCEKKIHFFERSLVGLGVECPNHGNRDHVADGEDVQRLFVDFAKHNRAEKSLFLVSRYKRGNLGGASTFRQRLKGFFRELDGLTDSNPRNADPFLHNLQPNDQLYSSSRMQVSRTPTCEH